MGAPSSWLWWAPLSPGGITYGRAACKTPLGAIPREGRLRVPVFGGVDDKDEDTSGPR